MNRTQKMSRRRTIKTEAERVAARVFCLCKELEYDDAARRTVAGSCRADGIESMKGMSATELAEMEWILKRELWKKGQREDFERRVRLAKHKRVDKDESPYASIRARHYLKQLAQTYWGSDWENKLLVYMSRMVKNAIPPVGQKLTAAGKTTYYVHWNDPEIPRDLHWRITEGLKAMMNRKS